MCQGKHSQGEVLQVLRQLQAQAAQLEQQAGQLREALYQAERALCEGAERSVTVTPMAPGTGRGARE